MGLRGVNENYPIVIGSYGGGEKPRIYVTSEDGRGDLVIVGNDVASNYVFENLHVVGSDFGAAFFLSCDADKIVFRNVTIEHFRIGIRSAEWITEDGLLQADSIRIEECTFRNNTNWAYLGRVDDFIVRNSEFYDNGLGSPLDHHIYFCGNNSLFENNLFVRTAGGAITTHEASNLVARNNIMIDCHVGGGIGINLGIEGTLNNITFERNIISGGDIPFWLTGVYGLVIRNNIFDKTGYIAFGDSHLQKDIYIYSNLFYKGTMDDISGCSNCRNFNVENNIFYSDGTGYQSGVRYFMRVADHDPEEFTIENNLYYYESAINQGGFSFNRIRYSLGEIQDLFGHEDAQLFGDPRLANPEEDDFHLTSESTLAIDRGSDLTGVVDDDFDGNLRPQGAGYDIGPYEYSDSVITPPPDVTAEQTSADGTSVELGEPTVSPEFGAVSVTNDAAALFPLGTTVVTWTATDGSGNTATGTQRVTIEDTTAPNITAPDDITVEQTTADGTAVGLGTPTVTDICDADPTVTNDAPDVFPLGTTTVTWTATDDAGNAATATQQVTVQDTTAPDITAPDDVTVQQTGVDGTPVELGSPTVNDTCDVNPTVTNDAPALFPAGTTTVIWTATDDSGNSASAVQSVTVVPGEPRFDFGTPGSPVEPGYMRVTEATVYSESTGCGWLSGTVTGRDRGRGTALTRDFNFTELGTFAVDVPNGTYDVTVTLGDASYPHEQMGVFLEGAHVDTVTTASGEFVRKTYQATVTDGQLTLGLDDLGGTSPVVVINALEVTPLPPGVIVQPTSGLVTTEDGGTAEFTVLLATEPSADVTIGLSSSDATEGTVWPESVTFTPSDWSTPQAVTVTGVDDDEADGDVAYSVATSSAVSADPDYAGLDPEDVSVTNRGDDFSGLRVDFGTSSSPVATGYTRVTEASAYSLSVGYGWLRGTVVSRDRERGMALTRDFNFTELATFAVDVPDGTYDVTVTLGDPSYPHEQMGVFLEGAHVDTVTTARGQFFTRSYQVTVADGQLTLGLDDLGGKSPFVVINALEVTLPPPGVIVRPASGLVTSEDGGTAEFTVLLATEPSADVTVGLSSSDATEGTVSPESVTFTPSNWTTPQAVTVSGVDDEEDDGNVAYSVATAPAVSADPDYDGLDPEDVSVMNRDDEFAGLWVDFGTSSSPVASGYTRVTEASAYSLSVGYGWLSGTAASRDRRKGTALTRDFNFTELGTFAVDVPNGTYDVTVTLGDACYRHQQMGVFLEGAHVDTVTTARGQFFTRSYQVTVADGQLTLGLDDLGGKSPFVVINAVEVTLPPPGVIVRPASGLVTSEDGGTAEFTVLLATEPSADVTVGLSSSDATEGTVSPESVTFTPGNWTTPQAVTVAGVDDEEDDGNVVYSVAIAPAVSADPDYDGLDPEDVPVTNRDDEFTGLWVDFGTSRSPVATGYRRVTAATAYSSSVGYGWLSGTVVSRDRERGTALTRDFNFTDLGTFAVDVPDGTYDVTVTLGDAGYRHEQMGVFLEGAHVDTVATAPGEFVRKSYQVTVSDGQLTLGLDDLGGRSPVVVIDGLEVEPATVAATPAPADEELAIVVSPEHGPAPLEVLALAVGAEPGAQCVWDFGDGTDGAGSAVAHTYYSPGTYTITLTSGGRTARATVEVGEPPAD